MRGPIHRAATAPPDLTDWTIVENLIKLSLGLFFIVFVSYLAYQIFVQASSDTYLGLTAEIEAVEAGNRDLAEKNALLRTKIDALRSDGRAIERKSRDELGMARPDEVILLFKDDG